MRIGCLVFVVFLAACGAATTGEVAEHTLPDPLFLQELPDPPEEVPPEKRMSEPAADCTLEGSDPPVKLPPGILISHEMGLRAARTKIAYDELRLLYRSDLATMDREREVYGRHLQAADEEVIMWRQRSERTWFERNGTTFGIVVGVVIGATLTVAILAAVEGVTEAVP